MAIGVSGTNSNSTSVQVSVGPAGFVHYRNQRSLPSSPLEDSIFLSGCFDPANRKCYSGGGTSATDFVSGINYTITGNANGDTIYKSDNAGIIEITGGGYIKSNGGYEHTSGFYDAQSIELWLFPATGATQEETLFQLRKYEGGSYKNGYTLTRRRISGNPRGIAIYPFDNQGLLDRVSTINNALWLNEWNRILINDWNLNELYRYFEIEIRSPYHTFYTSGNSSYADLVTGGKPGEYSITGEKELTIGKAEGITGTFRGKVGCIKIYEGPFFNVDYDPEGGPPDPSTFNYDTFDWAYYPLAPRYDQYKT